MEKTTKRSAIMKARYKCVYAFSSWQALFFFVDNDAFIARVNYLFSLSCFIFFFNYYPTPILNTSLHVLSLLFETSMNL